MPAADVCAQATSSEIKDDGSCHSESRRFPMEEEACKVQQAQPSRLLSQAMRGARRLRKVTPGGVKEAKVEVFAKAISSRLVAATTRGAGSHRHKAFENFSLGSG
eukprot:CAMPEP_0119308828 /NCGR_PEP_ID=MMETSP1333-20130426/12792_1 /TAXON_ID=418940 /ORGANISM="Scyphosphaera apsteinii, Strain RCC1455" /LENGTH=104 /DNA_ID=CAMNT_0007312687 /DNA_START=416 /DNA_END=727 /DNA_ORIENTATION=-